MEEIIHTRDLSKRYRGCDAVDRVSLRVTKGEIYGFLGLNGAGKTTTIRMLLGMIRPTSGACFIRGQRVNAGRYRIWEQVGYMVEKPCAYPELTVRENLELVGKLRRLNGDTAIRHVISQLKLTEYEHRKAKHLSLGNMQRLGIAKALVHRPDVLILDEPVNGLDPAGIVEIRELLQELASTRGTAVFISSHILGEISKIATRIGIIHHGRLIEELPKEELDRRRMARLLIKTRDNRRALGILSKTGHAFRENRDGVLETQSKGAIEQPDRLAKRLVEADQPPTMLLVEEEDLESYFLRVIGKGEKPL